MELEPRERTEDRPEPIEPSQTITILVLAAAPDLDLDLRTECREIQEWVRQSVGDGRVNVEYEPKARFEDWLQAINRHKPEIVHFMGHGSVSSIQIADGDRGSQELDAEHVQGFFEATGGCVELAVLHSCLSASQAESVAEEVGVAVGTSHSIEDSEAVGFSGAFYNAIASGQSIETAFQQGRLNVGVAPTGQSESFQLFAADGRDPDECHLIQDPG
jgi:hypothetical protein